MHASVQWALGGEQQQRGGQTRRSSVSMDESSTMTRLRQSISPTRAKDGKRLEALRYLGKSCDIEKQDGNIAKQDGESAALAFWEKKYSGKYVMQHDQDQIIFLKAHFNEAENELDDPPRYEDDLRFECRMDGHNDVDFKKHQDADVTIDMSLDGLLKKSEAGAKVGANHKNACSGGHSDFYFEVTVISDIYSVSRQDEMKLPPGHIKQVFLGAAFSMRCSRRQGANSSNASANAAASVGLDSGGGGGAGLQGKVVRATGDDGSDYEWTCPNLGGSLHVSNLVELLNSGKGQVNFNKIVRLLQRYKMSVKNGDIAQKVMQVQPLIAVKDEIKRLKEDNEELKKTLKETNEKCCATVKETNEKCCATVKETNEKCCATVKETNEKCCATVKETNEKCCATVKETNEKCFTAMKQCVVFCGFLMLACLWFTHGGLKDCQHNHRAMLKNHDKLLQHFDAQLAMETLQQFGVSSEEDFEGGFEEATALVTYTHVIPTVPASYVFLEGKVAIMNEGDLLLTVFKDACKVVKEAPLEVEGCESDGWNYLSWQETKCAAENKVLLDEALTGLGAVCPDPTAVKINTSEPGSGTPD